MESGKCSSRKIRDVVRLQQVLKKWRKQAASANKTHHNQHETIATSSRSRTSKKSGAGGGGGGGGGGGVPRGCLAVCVGREEARRFVIPTRYLGHDMFAILLREAEEEFGFQNEGVLRIPCEVAVFEKVLGFMERHETDPDVAWKHSSSSSSDVMESCCHHYYCSQMCR